MYYLSIMFIRKYINNYKTPSNLCMIFTHIYKHKRRKQRFLVITKINEN